MPGATPLFAPHRFTTRLVLIRHGQAQSFVDQVVGGHSGCTGLSALGREQAIALRDRLAATEELAGASALYASIMPRAIETAETIAPALGGLPVQTSCDLCEFHDGDADGLPVEEALERWWKPHFERHGLAGRFFPAVPGGESTVLFEARIARAIHEVVARHAGETVVVVCHGGVIRSTTVAFLGISSAREHLLNENTGITEWRYDAEEQRPRWRLARANDHAHLLGFDLVGPRDQGARE